MENRKCSADESVGTGSGNKKRVWKVFCASGIELGSHRKPLIILNEIFLRGESLENDRDIACQLFKSVDSAKEFINNATKAIHAYNQSLIKESEQISDDIETVIAE